MLGSGYSATGDSHDFNAWDDSGNVWDNVGLVWAEWVDDDFERYRIPAVELGTTGKFVAELPAGTARYDLRYRAETLLDSGVVWEDTTGTDLSSVSSAINALQVSVGLLAGVGDGAIPVDHDYGGVDALRYVDPDGAPIDNGAVLVYLAADYAADPPQRGSANIVARTTTNVDGRWAAPVMLDPAEYILVFYKQQTFAATTVAITVTG